MSKNTNLSFLTDYITADITNGRIGINNASPTVAFDVVGATKITGALTLTAALGGTSASFSSTITATQATFTATANTYAGAALILKAFGGTNPIYLTSVSGFFAVSNGGSADHLLISSTGAATFSSSVTANNNLSVIRNGSSLTTLGQSRFLDLSDYYGAANARMEIGLGYSAATGVTNIPAVIGYVQTSTTAYTLGDIYFATRSVTTDTAPTERMRITSAGNVGIGTSSPTGKFSVNTGASNQIAFFNNSTSGGTYNIISLNGSYSEGTNMSIQGGGVGDANLYVNSGYTSSTSGAIVFRTGSATVYTERMLITSGGDFLWKKSGSTVSGIGLWMQSANADIYSSIANGTNTYHVYDTTNSAYRFYVTGGGTINATNPVISAISDQRLKENITDLEIGLNAIMALRPRKFDWKEKSGNTGKNLRGFIAQEFEQVFPDLIDKSINLAPEGEEAYKQIRVDLMPVLVKAIQELSLEINLLKNK